MRDSGDDGNRERSTLGQWDHYIERLVEASPVTLYVFDIVAKKTLYTNHTLAERLGYTPAEVAAFGNEWLRHLHRSPSPVGFVPEPDFALCVPNP